MRGLVRQRDIQDALSTSGQTGSIVRSITAARCRGAVVIGMTGGGASPVGHDGAIAIRVPSKATLFIQEVHTPVGHAFCGMVREVVAQAERTDLCWRE